MHLLYVDELFLTGKEELIKDARRRLAVEFEMKVLQLQQFPKIPKKIRTLLCFGLV